MKQRVQDERQPISADEAERIARKVGADLGSGVFTRKGRGTRPVVLIRWALIRGGTVVTTLRRTRGGAIRMVRSHRSS